MADTDRTNRLTIAAVLLVIAAVIFFSWLMNEFNGRGKYRVHDDRGNVSRE